MGLSVEIGSQAIPVIANEALVRSLYFMRRFGLEIQNNNIENIKDLKRIDWEKVKPNNDPTIDRMLMIATGVFTSIDVSESIISQKYAGCPLTISE